MKIAIIGRSEILYQTIKKLVDLKHSVVLIITSKEAPEYTKTSEDFKNYAKKLDAKFFHTAKIQETLAEIKKIGEIDIAISVNYSGIIPQSVIDCFRLGILNAHGGDLPKYRGNACQAWAIINKEKKVGLCIHKMIGGELDSGDIIARRYLDININTRIGEIWEWMSTEIPDLFLESLGLLNNQPSFYLEKQSKNPEDILRCYPRNTQDGRIRWSLSNKQILRLINASSQPYSGAYFLLEDKKIVVWEAEIVKDQGNYLAIPGQVTKINEEFLEVAAAKGKIRLLKIESCKGLVSPSSLIKSTRTRLS